LQLVDGGPSPMENDIEITPYNYTQNVFTTLGTGIFGNAINLSTPPASAFLNIADGGSHTASYDIFNDNGSGNGHFNYSRATGTYTFGGNVTANGTLTAGDAGNPYNAYLASGTGQAYLNLVGPSSGGGVIFCQADPCLSNYQSSVTGSYDGLEGFGISLNVVYYPTTTTYTTLYTTPNNGLSLLNGTTKAADNTIDLGPNATVDTSGNLTATSFAATIPDTSSLNLGATIYSPSLATGDRVGLATGTSFSSGNSALFLWMNNATPYLSVQTYGSSSPVQISGSSITTSAPMAINNGGTFGALGPTCGSGISLCVNSASTFTVGTDGSIDAATNGAFSGTLQSGQYIGPATAPSGSCSTSGAWVFSQDGHATFCASGTWVTKI